MTNEKFISLQKCKSQNFSQKMQKYVTEGKFETMSPIKQRRMNQIRRNITKELSEVEYSPNGSDFTSKVLYYNSMNK